MTLDKSLEGSWRALRLGLGLMAVAAGLDKFFNLLTTWSMYMSPWAEGVVPVGTDTLMRVVGVVEMAVGLAILTAWTRVGAYVAMAWLFAITLNLVSTGLFYDLAARDAVLAIAAYTLARLTEARQAEGAPAGASGLARAALTLRSQ